MSELTAALHDAKKIEGKKKPKQHNRFSAYKVVARGAKINHFEPNSWFDGSANYRPGLLLLG